MIYVIDRIENGIGVCECLETGAKLEISRAHLPKGAKEGDVIRRLHENSFAIDIELTKKRRDSMSDRMNRLFEKN
ncbi:MAG: DUF3006 domain-containing protein [Defluviitaleaceae bacterium]|nr:DUF3006 domain-containing protein [Defluviitaleaceae bacterium]